MSVTFYTAGAYDDTADMISMTWNEIFSELSPSMINEVSDEQLWERLNLAATAQFKSNRKDYSGRNIYEFATSVNPSTFETVIIQLRALGLIKKSEKNRSVKDTSTYWTLTPYGNEVMNRLRAIRSRPF